MKLEPYLVFDGDCKEALTLYEKVLGGRIEFMQTFAESPMADQSPPATHNLVLHATLRVGESVLMASDAPPGKYEPPQGMAVSIGVDTVEEAERIFQALSENARSITMPLQETFWSPRFAMFADRFGTSWMINTAPKS